MTSKHEEVISRVFCDVIEQLAFMFGESVAPKDLVDAGESFVKVEMGFTGELDGSLWMVLTEEVCPEIAANVLGLDPDDKIAADRSYDAIKEVLNVTCGNLLTSISGEEPIFDLSIPQISHLNGGDWNELINLENAVPILVDDNPVLLCLAIEE
jgi:chemotaxis protein CheX